MPEPPIFDLLEALWEQAPSVALEHGERFAVFSDLHLGDGSRHDDFTANSETVMAALSTFYAPRSYKLILNGDIEELLRCRLPAIRERWKSFYAVLDAFQARQSLYKLEGNHDPASAQLEGPYPLFPALRLKAEDGEILVLHGHQAGRINSGRYNALIGAFLKLFANPLHIKNHSPAYHKQSRYEIERRIYEFAKRKKILAVIGHTHRPLFESQPKAASLESRLDALCHRWSRATAAERRHLEPMIEFTRLDWESHRDSPRLDLPHQLYNREFLLPCVFNSGTSIGRGGVTGLEISRKKIRLVHWSDLAKPSASKVNYEYETRRIFAGRWSRTILRKSSLAYLFARMKFLAVARPGEGD